MIAAVQPARQGAPLPATREPSLEFSLPASLEAAEPPEARGLARDQVRLLVSYLSSDSFRHARFRDLPQFLRPGDVLVINTSGTLPAALPARDGAGRPLELHLSTRLPDGNWTVELRWLADGQNRPFFDARVGDRLELPAGATASLLRPYRPDRRSSSGKHRLWVAQLQVPRELTGYLAEHGYPIRYDYVSRPWPTSLYQTVYATEAGSAEMPSAGRAFTPELITRLVASGVQVVPLILHTGVASLEADESPYEESFVVPEATARAVNSARAAGGRIIAVGTTTVRALETVANKRGQAQARRGLTSLVITPERRLRLVDGLVTGFHEPKASHLLLLEALAGRRHLALAYHQALQERYLWHEFGDLHLILP